MATTDLHVVLYEPEIPQNTGTIGRMCLATNATLHLIEPFSFELSDKYLKRAGLDYWEHLKVQIHTGLHEFLATVPKDAHLAFIEEKAGNTIYEHEFKTGTYLIFGRETSGLPDWVMNTYASQTLRIPMFDARVRSLNLSNAVSITLYEAIRQVRLS